MEEMTIMREPKGPQRPYGALDLHAHYGDVRARLRNAPRSDPPKAGTVAAPAPPPSGGEPPALAAIPLEIRDVVAHVAATLALAPYDLMADLGKTASLGRRIAAALAVRRVLLSANVAARLFGVAESLVTDALVPLDAVLAFTQASATHAPLAPLVDRVVAAWQRFEEPTRQRIPVSEIQAVVARVYRVSMRDLKSARRTNDIVRPRHVAIYLAQRFTLNSVPEIARAFGGRDHTTAAHAVKKISPYAEAVASKISPDATVEDWARALRTEMG
jgi:hypothetical protein